MAKKKARKQVIKHIDKKIKAAETAVKALEREVFADANAPKPAPALFKDALSDLRNLSAPPPLDIEFDTTKPAVAKKNAVRRARKVDTGLAMKSLIESFQTDVNAQLAELTQKVEGQITALVNTVATIATTKANFATQVSFFRDSLKTLLGLDEELEPIEIEEMFFGGHDFEDAPEDPKIRAAAERALDEAEDDTRLVGDADQTRALRKLEGDILQ